MPETLFLTVNLIDRFLAEKQVTRKNLQLVSSYAESCRAGLVLHEAQWADCLGRGCRRCVCAVALPAALAFD